MRFLLLLFFFLTNLSIYGQTTPYYFVLNRVSDLPSDIVYDIYQDQQSFIWLATEKGISRYDGLYVKPFQFDNSPAVSVTNISEDGYGRIWMQNFAGDIYYIQNQKYHRFTQAQANGYLRYGLSRDILYIAGKEHVFLFSLKDFKLINKVKVPPTQVTHTLLVNDKFYLIGDQLISIDAKGKTEIIDSTFDNTLKGVVPVAHHNKLLIFSKFTPDYIEVSNNRLTSKKLPFTTSFTQNISIIDDQFWICTTKGLYNFDEKSQKYKHYLPEINVSYIIKTKENNYWISSINSGALYIENFDSNFIKTPSKPAKITKQNNAIVFSTYDDQILRMKDPFHFETVYKGDSDHIISPFIIDSLNQQLIMASSKLIIKTPQKKLSNILAVKRIIQLDKKYFLIAGSSWSGIIFTNEKLTSSYDKQFKNLPHHTENGIHFLTLEKNESGKDILIHPETQDIYLITNLGIKQFTKNKTYLIRTTNNAIKFTHLSWLNHKLYVLGNDEKLYELKNKSLKPVILPDFISNDHIYKIKTLKDRLYLFKGQSLYSFNPKENTIFKIINIPQSIEIYDLTSLNDFLYLSCSKGIIKTPHRYVNTSQPVHLYIHDIIVNGETLTKKDLLKLKSHQNSIEINYDVVSESPNNKYQIFYRMNNEPWEKVENNTRTLRFSSLKAGEYNLLLKVTNGNQNLEHAFRLNIEPPFYKKWWFILFTALSILGVAYYYFKQTIKNIEKETRLQVEQAQMEKLVNQSKLKSIKSQMNPHFFFNALNTLQSYILANEKREAVDYLSKFSKLTRSILDMSEKETHPLSEEVQTLSNYLDLEKTRFNGNFDYGIWVDENLREQDPYIPTLLLQPFVENALKHGLLHKKGEKVLNIKFLDHNDSIEVTVDDNGIGRKQSSELNRLRNPQHQSFATQAMNERIQLLNYRAQRKIKLEYIDKPNGQGTTVKLFLPKNTNLL